MRSYQATALIDAPPEQVWRVLTDIAASNPDPNGLADSGGTLTYAIERRI
jgi:hypothetical protein